MLIPSSLARLLLLLTVLTWTGRSLVAQDKIEAGPAPANQIQDAANMLSTEDTKALEAEIASLAQSAGIRVFVDTVTFLSGDINYVQRARELRKAWVGDGLGLVIAHARSGAPQPTVQMSPAVWSRYTEVRVAGMLKRVGAAIGQADKEQSAQLKAAIVAVIDNLRDLEAWHSRELSFAERWDLAIAIPFAILLLVGALLIKMVSHRRKIRETEQQKTFLFPEVHVPERLGAPHGGGVIAEINFRV